MKLLIVDDDMLICQSLKLLLGKEEDLKVINIASNGKEAINLCMEEQPDVILMDIQMPIMNGIESTKKIKEKWPKIQIMMLTTFQDEINIKLALKAGAEGYLLKSAPIENMAKQIRLLNSGSAILDTDVLKTIMQPNKEKLEGLTKREIDIIELVAQGFSNKEISNYLFLSEGTIRNTLSVILDKLEIRDRTQLAIYYLERKQDRNI